MQVDLVVKNARIPFGEETILCDILVNNEKIVGFIEDSGCIQRGNEIDAEGFLTLPGCIDSHVHFMDPGFCHRETFLSGTSAAAAGGVTTVIDMPCCSIPSVRDVDSMMNKIAAIDGQAMVDYALWGGVTGEDVRQGKLDNVQKQADEGVVGFKAYMTPSVPSYPRSNDAELLEIFKVVAETGLPLGVHTENYTICDYFVNKLREEGRMDSVAWAEARMELAEKSAIELCISFAEYSGARMHVVHMSTGVGAKLIEAGKMRGIDVTAETCPHYLVLNAEESMGKWGSFAKIAPPLRTVNDNEILWEKLRNGAVDFVATDHAPYEIASEKTAEGMTIWNSFPGIPGVETIVPIMVSEGLNKGRIGLKRLVEVLSENPAKHYGLYPKKGSMAIGADADFTIIDCDAEWIYDSKSMHSMAQYSPFDGMKFKGKVMKTVVRGTVVYDRGKLIGSAGYGKFIRRQNIRQLDRTLTL
ncbi:MAG TPA: allantoinase AllB [Clostridiaceae bacterium]|jgi:dihydropyrimidinase/allantoinase|nr:allantoinase AllB [Clostridiaceae bacterium]HHX19356.1 allantoinase AllB [Clostridiaceae bacterium]